MKTDNERKIEELEKELEIAKARVKELESFAKNLGYHLYHIIALSIGVGVTGWEEKKDEKK